MCGKPDKQSGAYQVGVQVSSGVYAKVAKKDQLQPVQSRFAGDHTDAVQVQGSGDSGREQDAGSVHLLISIPSKMSVSSFMGYLKEKCTDDV